MESEASPFHGNQWPRSIIYPREYNGDKALSLSWDLGAVSGSEKKKVIAAWIATLPTLQHLERLNLWSLVTQPLFDAACEIAGLQVLQVKWSNVQDLAAIARLQKLRALSIGSSTRVKSIEPLARLRALKFLEIENFKLISDFSPLAKLTGLEALSVTGSMWSRQKVGSLEPFASMTWLSSLSIDTTNVKSLQPLARLKDLQYLGLGGRLAYEEYAWLSGKLPNTKCRWFSPFYELTGSGYGPCKSCRRDSMVMLTGRGKPVVCRHCESAKVEKHVELFNSARDLARME